MAGPGRKSVYAYLAYDLLSGSRIAEVPLSGGVTYTSQVPSIGDGGLTGRIHPSAAMGTNRAGRPDLAAVLGYRTKIYVVRDGRIMWGGFFRYWDQAPDGVSLAEGGCPGLLSYFAHREIRTTLTYSQVDQLLIGDGIIATMQAKTGGNIGIVLRGKTSGVLRDRTYPGTELKEARAALVELSQVQNGFDVRLESGTGPAGPVDTLVLSYPRTDLAAPVADLPVLTYPGNIRSYTGFGDSGLATDVAAVGGGDGIDAIRAYSVNQHLLDAGWPVLERSVSFTDVTQLTTLQDHADAEAETRAYLSFSTTLDLGPDDPPLGTYDAGDWFRLRIKDDPFFGVGGDGSDIDVDARATQRTVSVPDSGEEKVSLTVTAKMPI